jgi:uncharacterized protein YbjT (DUF2867 family)
MMFGYDQPMTRRWLAIFLLGLCGCAAAGFSDAAGRSHPRVLVLGGTGQLGGLVVRELLASGARVVVLVRPSSDRSTLAGLTVDFVTGDLLVADDVARALRGRRVDVVVSAVRVDDGDFHFYSKMMPPLLKAARAAGVQQFIHHGAVGAGDNVKKFSGLGWERVPGIFERLKDQGEGERLLRESGIHYTIIRNARLYPVEQPPTGVARLTEDDTVLTPMTRADLARLTRECLLADACRDKTYHVRDDSLAWPATGR